MKLVEEVMFGRKIKIILQQHILQRIIKIQWMDEKKNKNSIILFNFYVEIK